MEKPLPNHTPFDAGGTLRFHWGTRRWEVKPHVGTRRRIPGHTEFRQNTTEMAVSQSTVALGARFVGAPGGFHGNAWEVRLPTPRLLAGTVESSGPCTTFGPESVGSAQQRKLDRECSIKKSGERWTTLLAE